MTIETMKAVRIHAYGGPEVLRYEDVSVPEPGPGEVRVRVCAVGVNPMDWMVREGYLREVVPYPLPLVPGWDISGVVAAVGPETTRFAVGDAVYGMADLNRNGGYAEYAVVREGELAPKPPSLDHVHAAAVPLTALTAWQALFDTAQLSAGQTVLIHGAAGGVGSFAVQLARLRGAYVVGTASSANVEFLRDLGAERVIDYTTTSFEEHVHDADIVLDTIGGDVRERSWSVLRRGGILVSLRNPPPSEQTARERGVRGAFVFVRPDTAALAQITTLIEAGHIRPVVSAVYPLVAAGEAQERNRGGHTRGKLVVQVAA